MIISECCGAKLATTEDTICGDCKKPCNYEVLPTTHKEKTEYLYGSFDMALLEDEIPLLQKRIDAQEEYKIKVLFDRPSTSLTYKHVTDILHAQKLFENMIAEIKAALEGPK